MRWARAVAWKIAVAGMAAAAIGIAVLFAYAASEVAADPSLSLIDGYWIGRLPWTAVGVDLVVFGSTIAVVAGTVGCWLAGGWIARTAATLAAIVAAFWWFVALRPQPGGAPCTACATPTADPMAYAYSLPENVVLFLIVPAVVATIAAARARPRTPTTNPAVGRTSA